MKIEIDIKLIDDKEIQNLIIWALKDKRRRQNLYKALYIILLNKNPVKQSALLKYLGISKNRLYKFIKQVSFLIQTREVLQEAQGHTKEGYMKLDKTVPFPSRYSVRDRNKAGYILMTLGILKTVEKYYNYKRGIKRAERVKK